MNIEEMNLEELETRSMEIAEEAREADKETIERLNAELDSIEQRKLVLQKEIEERAKAMKEVIEGNGEIKEEVEERKMTDREIRSSQNYIDAYVEYCKKNYDLDRVGAEARALLTENATNGTVAVPTYVEDKVTTAWENDEIMKGIRKTFFAGNVKVGVEVSSDGAVVHTEGGNAIAEENLVLNYIDLIPEYLKKMVKVSHTAMALTGNAFLDYLYDEIEYQLVKKAASQAVVKMVASTLTASYTKAGTDIATIDIVNAEGLLGGEAMNPVVITTRATAAALKAAALSASYGYDPFDGMPVLYTDATSLGSAEALVADLSGIQANFPEGAEPKFIFDEFTEAPANIVRIVGRLLMAVDVVAAGKVVKIA
jgi:HK97 family phage major capsid protein